MWVHQYEQVSTWRDSSLQSVCLLWWAVDMKCLTLFCPYLWLSLAILNGHCKQNQFAAIQNANKAIRNSSSVQQSCPWQQSKYFGKCNDLHTTERHSLVGFFTSSFLWVARFTCNQLIGVWSSIVLFFCKNKSFALVKIFRYMVITVLRIAPENLVCS